MRDGVHIAADIYLPDATPAPTILTRTPYLKDPLRQRGAPLPPVPFANMPPIEERMANFTEAGFAVVVSDTRGTGHSEGEYDYYNFEQGPLDGVDMISWIESEPWCDGNIGMMGTSAGAVLAYCAANEQPSHLKAMVANMHPSDAYLDQWFVGGIFRYQNRIGWCTGMLERILPLSTVGVEGPFKDRIRDVHQQRFDRYYRELQAGEGPINMDWFRRLFDEKQDGPFWRAISVSTHHDRVNVPVFNQGVWYDHFGRGTLDSHSALSVPKRLMMSPGMHGTRDGDGGFGDDQLRFFQHHLRGEDNGVMEDSPVRLYHMGREAWVDHGEWPPEAETQSWYLARGGNLQMSSPASTDTVSLQHDPESPNRSISRPQDLRRFEEGALVFTSPPMTEDTLVIGDPVLTLYAETDAED
ncbi:MAG: CocE/NonD family hydrolase, partial [Pseudomonadota bacterium]